MSSLALPYSSQHWARACPYAERARPELQWHDRTALALDSTLLAPVRDLLQRDLRVMRRVAQDALARAEAMDALSDDA
ncbi:MAG: hypothetical protein K2X75_11520, partial [Burkholderiaceae bacterium]|nr:hypothetical protein [Burkholderiaceae bacterium]